MPRPVKIRVSYRNDVGFLLRFEGSILQDVRQTAEWREKIARKVHELAMDLLAADSTTNMGTSKAKVPSVEPKKIAAR